MDSNDECGAGASPCHGSDVDKVAGPVFEGFESLLEQVQLLGRQHASLERKLASAQAQVSPNSLYTSFLQLHDEIYIALDLELRFVVMIDSFYYFLILFSKCSLAVSSVNYAQLFRILTQASLVS